MPTKKDILRHFLLNTLTVLSFELERENLSSERGERILQLLKTCSLVISNESLFLNKQPNLFLQRIDLKEILDIVSTVLGSQEKRVKTLEQSVFLNADKNYLIEAFKHLINKILDSADRIELEYDDGNSTLTIKHNAKQRLKIEKQPLDTCLTVKDMTVEKMEFQLALAIFDLHGYKIQIDGNSVKVEF